MGKRARFKHYVRDASYDLLKQALPSASAATRQKVNSASDPGGGRPQPPGISNTADLLVAEELALVTGGTITWEFYHPIKLVQYVLDHCPSFASLCGEKLKRCPSTPERPWRILLGCDEQTPGSKVSHNNDRKNMCVMMNFLELGADILESDATWFVPVVVQSSLIKKVCGGWSTMLKVFLRCLLLGPLSFTSAGVFVRHKVEWYLTTSLFRPDSEEYLHMRSKLQMCLTDGEGLAKCLQWNGHGSMRPCFAHSSVFKKQS